jgi:hypothetical protein
MLKKKKHLKKHANQQPGRHIHVIYKAVSVLEERSSICISVVIKKEINGHNLFRSISIKV